MLKAATYIQFINVIIIIIHTYRNAHTLLRKDHKSAQIASIFFSIHIHLLTINTF